MYQALFDHLEKCKTIDRDMSEPASKRMKRNTSNITSPPWLTQAAERGLEKLEKYYPLTDGLVYIVNTGWPKESIDYSRKCISEVYKSQYKPKNTAQNENAVPSSSNETKKVSWIRNR